MRRRKTKEIRISCYKLRENFGYYELTFYFDVFTKMILAWSLTSKRGDRNQYIDGLEQVKAIIEANGITEPIILHTDQGPVYSSQVYNDLIKSCDTALYKESKKA